METKFVRLDYKNSPAASAVSEEHRKAIEEQAADGFSYAGYFPVKMGPSGKMLAADGASWLRARYSPGTFRGNYGIRQYDCYKECACRKNVEADAGRIN